MNFKKEEIAVDAKKRKIGIIIAVVLGSFMFMYLTGIVGQILSGYNAWMAQDGMSGNAIMPEINFGFLYCIVNMFTPEGMKGAALIGVISIAIIAVYMLHNRFDIGKSDERNFRRSTRGTYGTAGWMEPKDMKQVLEVTTPAQARGTILGEKDGKVLCLPENTNLAKHIAVFGATGTMKSRAFVRNLLFQAIKRGESVVCTDPKAEIYELKNLFTDNGYETRVFNLVSPDHSDSWNCMADLNGDTMTAQILTDIIIENTVDEDSKSDHFWDYNETNLLKALILYIDLDPARGPEHKHLPAVYQLLTQYSEKQLIALFDRLPISHPAKAPFNLYKNCSDNVRAGVISGLGTRLQVMQSEAIKRITSRSDIDLTLPGKKKCAYFLILSDQDNSLSFLSSLFFSSLFMKLVRYADSTRKKRCKIPVNIVLEEANTCGSIHELHIKLSSIRSRHLIVSMVIQNLAQLKNRYPKDKWAEILGNMDTQLMLGCTDEVTAEMVSRRSGDMTVEVDSSMTMRKTIAIAQVIPEYRAMEGQGRRRVLTPDEVLRLPNDEMLIMIRGHNILKARKFDYTHHPMAKKIKPCSIYDYYGTHFNDEPDCDISLGPQENSESEIPVPGKTINMPSPDTALTGSPLYGSAKPPDEF